MSPSGYDDFNFEMEVLRDETETLITLSCKSDRPLTVDEYVFAIRSFADRIETLTSIAELANTVN